MKNNPLILSLLVGLIMVLVIAGVSLLVSINYLSGHKDELARKNMELEKSLEQLKTENTALIEKNKGLTEDVNNANTKVEELKTEMAKLEKLKDKLEENLKEELMKHDTNVRK
jgi:predicted nuclease with TOPRIM domain